MIPNVSNAIRRFEETLQFQIVKKTISEGDLDETSKVKPPLFFEGSLQPMGPSDLLVKSEGERKFKWWKLFTDLALDVDQVVKDTDGNTYRVMASSDWDDAGYHEYQLTQGPSL